MEFRQALDELRINLVEIKKQNRSVLLRKILKFILIGFLIGRKPERKIGELAQRNKLILDELLKPYEDLAYLSQTIRESADANTRLKQIEAELADARNIAPDLGDRLRNCRDSILSQATITIKQREEAIEKQVSDIEDSRTYLIHTNKQLCVDIIKSLDEDLTYCKGSAFLDGEYIREKQEQLSKLLQVILEYNENFVKQRKTDYAYLWREGSLSLDDEQQTAIVTDDKHNLVVAAAGSGKTEVLITRIAYLTARKPDTVQPRRILALAYQRKAKEEIEQRLRDRYSIRNVNIGTFHKLGKDILEETGKEFEHTDIVDENKKHEIIQKIFKHKMDNDPDFYPLFLKFVKTLHDKDTREDLGAKDAALAYAKERTYYSIDRTRVNSQAEKEIMDFFLTRRLNDKPIQVKYEPDVNGFRPDFWLPQYDLFIEHWALNEKGEVPPWFSQSTEEYKKTMEMKRKWFAENRKSLVETFAHEYKEDAPDQFTEFLKERILQELQTRHKDPLEFTFKTYKEIVELAWQSYRTPIDDIVNFITTAKTYGLTPARIAGKLRNTNWTSKQLAFGNLALPPYLAYEDLLREYGKIDFEDMINNAVNELDKDQSLRADTYDHILIDEYQDISAQRYRLIKKLMERNPMCKLFCVGDDWQSIMGFSGSNLHFFVNFQQYFENPAITRISTNYRSVKTIVDAGAELIKKNTSCQIQKPTMSKRSDVKLIKVLRSPHREQYESNYHYQTAEDCVSRIANYLQNGYSPKDILVLSRCMRTRIGHGYRFLSCIQTFIEEARHNGLELAYENKYTQSKVRLLTAHRSKGLEARVVFLLNVTSGRYGFPCEIEDPAIYEPARENYPPQDSMEEERRLFYVAMTRAMEDLYIYTWEPAVSRFLEEITNYTEKERLNY